MLIATQTAERAKTPQLCNMLGNIQKIKKIKTERLFPSNQQNSFLTNILSKSWEITSPELQIQEKVRRNQHRKLLKNTSPWKKKRRRRRRRNCSGKFNQIEIQYTEKDDYELKFRSFS